VTGKRDGIPTVRRRRLGTELRRYRETAGLTIDYVAGRLECSGSKISRIETGHTGASPRDVREMLLLYRVGEPELTDLVEIARGTRQRGWWQPYGSILTGAYVGLEAAAQLIRSYENQCVPGLLQTEEYAVSVIRARLDISPEELRSRVGIRMARQLLLAGEAPVEFCCIIDEGVLRRPVGGPEVMRRQLVHLVEMSLRPNLSLHILPFSVGAHAGMEGPFVLLSYPDPADPDSVYVTMATGGVFLDKPEDVQLYSAIFNRLREAALPAGDAAAFIAKLMDDLDSWRN
jgi:transcriptional regulator with XRE-family HTH domain